MDLVQRQEVQRRHAPITWLVAIGLALALTFAIAVAALRSGEATSTPVRSGDGAVERIVDVKSDYPLSGNGSTAHPRSGGLADRTGAPKVSCHGAC